MSGNADGSVSPPIVPGGDDKKPETPPKDTVAYETHRRLLDEKKKLQDKYDALQSEKDAAEKKKLEDNGEYQKLLDLEKKRADEAAAKLAGYEERFTEAKKLKAVLNALDSGIDEKFYGMLPLDQIMIDPETKEINMTSVAEAASVFKKSFPELLKPKSGVKLPTAAPQGNSAGTISRDEWLKLPAKEMQKYRPNQII